MRSSYLTSRETLLKTLTKEEDIDVHYGTAIKRMRGQRSLQGICQEKKKNFPKSKVLRDLNEQDVFDVNFTLCETISPTVFNPTFSDQNCINLLENMFSLFIKWQFVAVSSDKKHNTEFS